MGDNKNILLELNIEQTRHNEIQLVGNGDWCLTLGGRDCSLQMHEQKLLEVSITQETLRRRQSNATRAAGNDTQPDDAIQRGLSTSWRRMEEPSQRASAKSRQARLGFHLRAASSTARVTTSWR